MTNQIDSFSNPHTLHQFDTELAHLHGLVVEMAELVINQLDQVMQTLDGGKIKLARKIMLRYEVVNQYQIKIDTAVLEVLALHTPVANDLKTVIATSKIAVELQNISDETYQLARMITVFFYPKAITHNSKLLADTVKAGRLIINILAKLIASLDHKDSRQTRELLQNNPEYKTVLQEGIKHQFNFMRQNPSLISSALEVMQMMKSLEQCYEDSIRIANQIIFMINGIDVRQEASRTQL